MFTCIYSSEVNILPSTKGDCLHLSLCAAFISLCFLLAVYEELGYAVLVKNTQEEELIMTRDYTLAEHTSGRIGALGICLWYVKSENFYRTVKIHLAVFVLDEFLAIDFISWCQFIAVNNVHFVRSYPLPPTCTH